MLENIKMLLGLSTSEYDEKITYYIKKYTSLILNYCNIEELNYTLEGLIEDNIYNLMKPLINGSSHASSNNSSQEIKSISRGDTKIDYNVATPSADTISSSGKVSLTSDDKKVLNSYRKLRR